MITPYSEENIKIISPPNFGWIEKNLSCEEINYLWNSIKNQKECLKSDLAGIISESNVITDDTNWFFLNTLVPLCKVYADNFSNVGEQLPTNQRHPYYLEKMWVNYQKKNEFNPVHKHKGIYSFVVWMKIPTKYSEQNNNPLYSKSNSKKISTFNFYYTNILGEIEEYTYEMNPNVEGTIVFFPSKLKHSVYPFYDCEECRISISGNISLDTNLKIEFIS